MSSATARTLICSGVLAAGLAVAVMLHMSMPAHAGSVSVAGKRISCAGVRFRFDRKLNNYGMYWPGLIKLNPDRLRGLPRVVQRFVVLHECGHRHFADEAGADCWAAKHGRRQGWLTVRGIRQVCMVFRRHPKNIWRCAKLKRCFAG